jgi:acetyl esterase/lipase
MRKRKEMRKNIISFMLDCLTVLSLALMSCSPTTIPMTEESKEVTPSPAEFTISDLSVIPANIKPGEQVTVSVVVTNTGGSEGSYTVILKINGVEESTKEVTIKANRSETVDFYVTRDKEGSYKVSIDDKIGEFNISAPTPIVTPTSANSGPPFTEDETAIAQLKPPISSKMRQYGIVQPDVVYGVAGGVELKMDIYYPKQYGAKVPVVIYVHGGAFRAGDKRDMTLETMTTQLLARGYMVVSLNYRLVPQGGTFPFQVEDVKSAVRYIRGNAAKYQIDTTKIGVIGGSSGGYLVNMMGLCDSSAGFDNSGDYLNQSSRVQAVVDLFGVTDIVMQDDTGRIEGHNGPVSSFIGNTSQFQEIAVRATPLNYVSMDDPPFLIMHGDKDTDVIPKQSEMLYNKLVEAGVPATLVWIKNGGHSFVQVGKDPISPGWSEITNMIADFFDKYLK